jgi:acetoin utilization deacetylase AcuC-like enzyme
MLTVFSSSHHLHHGKELKDGALTPSFEEPGRADAILRRVRAVGLGEAIACRPFGVDQYVGAHSGRYVRFLSGAWEQWSAGGRSSDALPLVWPVRNMRDDIEPAVIEGKLGYFSMDAGAPITAHTWNAVAESANLALTGAELVLEGARGAFALCRPPGHHAGREYMGGYCYLNNAAIAASHAIAKGLKRVAVLDVDFHHGNGTQDIFYDRSDVLTVSIHGDPSVSYPYFSGNSDERGRDAGEGFNLNLPLPKGTDWPAYSQALKSACRRVVAHAPELLVVSLGVDTFENDPISHFLLKSDDFSRLGEQIAALQCPTLFVMEGGYMVDEIGINAVNVLQAFEARG